MATESGVGLTTIQDVETGSGNFELATVIKLIEAMPGLSVSQFFWMVESRASGHEANNHPATEIADGARDHEPRSVSSPDSAALAELRSFIAHLASVLAAAAKADSVADGSFSDPAAPQARNRNVSS